MSILSTLLFLTLACVLLIIIIQNVIVPAVVNYNHGTLNNPDFTIGPSKIQGLGVFTKRPRVKDERLFVAINADESITLIGSKINHCPNKDSDGFVPPRSVLPNTYLSATPDKNTGEWWIIAARDIDAHEELTTDYTYTPDFIDKPDPSWRCPLL